MKLIDGFRPNEKAYVHLDDRFTDDDFLAEIGDTKQPTAFYPQLKVARWGNDANFSARIKGAVSKEPTTEGEAVVYQTDDYKARFYYVDGGFEFDITQFVKPASPVVEFTLQHKNLNFWYQPELRPDQIAEGHERPDDIVGSYAVYHTTKRDHISGQTNYKVGKAFHIKRPWAVDANGLRVWCDLFIDPDQNLMTITLPDSFYQSAVWPVIIDPTFGYLTEGGTNAGSISDRGYGHGNSGQQYTASSGDTLTIFHMFTRTTGATANVGVYDKGGGGNSGASLLGTGTITASSETQTWETANVSIGLTAGNTHFIAYRSNSSIRRYYDTPLTAGDSTEDSTPDSTGLLDATWAENTTDDELVSFYFTYTTGGGSFQAAWARNANSIIQVAM